MTDGTGVSVQFEEDGDYQEPAEFLESRLIRNVYGGSLGLFYREFICCHLSPPQHASAEQ